MPLHIEIKVVPSSGKHQWAFDRTGKIKCFLKSPPENGKANAELIKSIARGLKIQESRVTLVTGASCRTKVIKIDADITRDQFILSVGLEIQQTLF